MAGFRGFEEKSGWIVRLTWEENLLEYWCSGGQVSLKVRVGVKVIGFGIDPWDI